MKKLIRTFAVLVSISLCLPACGTLSNAASTIDTQVSAVGQSLSAYCEVAGPSDPEIAKICDYVAAGVLAAEVAVPAILNIFRARAARTLQAKAATNVSAK